MTKPIEWKVDKNGMVLGPGFHDGFFYGVTVTENKSLCIFVRNYKNEPLIIKLITLVNLNLTNFWGECIIGDVWLFNKAEAPPYMWKKLLRDKISEVNYQKDFERIFSRKEDIYFFALECSYGGALYATCSSIEIFAGAGLPS